MFDSRLRPLIDPPLNWAGRQLAGLGVTANNITIAGMVIGIAAAGAIAVENFLLGLALIGVNRLFDGLDGAIARATKQTDFGGYLDIVADFVFYVSIPVGFGLANPSNSVWAMILIASFTVTCASFLAFATLAAKRGIETSEHGKKSFFYNTGLAEGTETIICFVLMALLPAYFSIIAFIFSIMCLITIFQRSYLAAVMFHDKAT
jgi:phosphatidylglycerophosphate synthase